MEVLKSRELARRCGGKSTTMSGARARAGRYGALRRCADVATAAVASVEPMRKDVKP